MFERPLVLVILALPPLWILVRSLARRDLLLPLSLSDSTGAFVPRPPALRRSVRNLRLATLWLGFALVTGAAAGPAIISPVLLFLSRGNEIMFVLDVSPSMAASDFHPDRLSAAREIMRSFLAKRRNEAVGLVAFGGEAALVSPPTLDYRTLLDRIATLKPGMFGEGTAIGAGIGVAAAHGRAGTGRERHIIVLTDGENNAGALAPLSAVALASDAGFVVSVVGVGSRGEVPLSYVDPATGARRNGIYLSGFDRGALEAIARRGGGSYYDAGDAKALVAAFDRISDRSLSLTKTRSVASERSLLPLFLALGAVALSLSRLLELASGSELP